MAALYEIKRIFTNLCAAYPEFKPPNVEATLKQYEEALQVFPTNLLNRAADRCRDACVYFPKIADIRKAISEIRTAEQSNNQGVDESWKDIIFVPMTPEIQKKWDDFRQHMVDSGKWKEARRVKETK